MLLSENSSTPFCDNETSVVQFIISVKKPPLGILIFFMFFAAVGFLLPLVVIFIFKNHEENPSPAIILITALFWIGSYYLLRLILWNLYGREIIQFSDNGIDYFFDFRYFKSKIISFQKNNELKIELSSNQKNEEGSHILTIEQGLKKVQTSIPINRNTEISTLLEKYNKPA